MELRYIRLFCLIEEHGSISKAAEVAGFSQPTVSQHLKTLETLLGVRLFDRSGRRVDLTSAGRVFLPYARRMLSLADEAGRALEEHGGAVRGDLQLAGSTIPSTYLLPEYFGRFRAEYPDVVPHLSVTDSGRVCELVFSRSVELGFVGASADRPGLEFTPFATDELVVLARPDHRFCGGKCLPLEELLSEPLISRERGSGTRAIWEAHLTANGASPGEQAVVAELGSTEAVLRGIRAGLGPGVVSSIAAGKDIRDGTLEFLHPDLPPLKRTFFMVRHTGRELSPCAGAFFAFVVSLRKKLQEENP